MGLLSMSRDHIQAGLSLGGVHVSKDASVGVCSHHGSLLGRSLGQVQGREGVN